MSTYHYAGPDIDARDFRDYPDPDDFAPAGYGEDEYEAYVADMEDMPFDVPTNEELIALAEACGGDLPF